MSERVERHGHVTVVVGDPSLEVGADELCPRCGLVVQEHHFRWPKPDSDVMLRLFVEACYCGVRFTDAADQSLDETPELWGKPGKWWCNFCDYRSDDEEEYLAHSCVETLEQRQNAGSDEAHP
jgi:hypothetical protein